MFYCNTTSADFGFAVAVNVALVRPD